MDYERLKNEVLYKRIKKEQKTKNNLLPVFIWINAILTYTIIILMSLLFIN